MPLYKVVVEETIQKTYLIEAETSQEAEDNYLEGKIEDIREVQYEVIRSIQYT